MMTVKERIELARDNLYEKLPSGDVGAFELIKIIQAHIAELDSIISELDEGEAKKG